MISWSSPTTGRKPAYVVCSALAAGLLLAGCSGSQSSNLSSGGSQARAGAPVPDAGIASKGSLTQGAVSAPGLAPATTSGDVVPALLDRSIIRTANMTVRVKNVLDSAGQAESLAAGAGGFVAGEQTEAEPDHPDQARAVITVRVPGSALSGLLADLGRLGALLSEDQSSSDVTGQVIDVQARLQSQQASVDRIRALLAQAKTIGQVVEIEGELATREGALESLQGQAKQLADQTSLATVTATLVGPGAAAPVKKPVETGFKLGLTQGWKAFTSATTWLLTALGTVLPFLVLGALAAWAAALGVRRRRTLPPVVVVPSSD